MALEAVVADIGSASADLTVNLGDLVAGPFDPAGAAEAQMALACPTLRGNNDRWVVEDPSRRTDALARSLLSAAHLDWLSALPATLSLADGDVFACHGSPASGDTEYLLEDMSSGRTVLAPDADIAPRLSGIGRAGLVSCGHTHLPRVVKVGGVLVVNPGSVGWPAYSDVDPCPHSIEVGSPYARYAIVTRAPTGWSVELRSVTYEWEAAAGQAEFHDRPDVAYAARTGRVL